MDDGAHSRPALPQPTAHPQLPQRNTQNQYIKNYDFSYRLPPNPAHHDFTVTAVLGHLTEGVLPEETKSWQGCDPFILFDAPITHQVDPVRSPSPRSSCGPLEINRTETLWHRTQPPQRGEKSSASHDLDRLR